MVPAQEKRAVDRRALIKELNDLMDHSVGESPTCTVAEASTELRRFADILDQLAAGDPTILLRDLQREVNDAHEKEKEKEPR